MGGMIMENVKQFNYYISAYVVSSSGSRIYTIDGFDPTPPDKVTLSVVKQWEKEIGVILCAHEVSILSWNLLAEEDQDRAVEPSSDEGSTLVAPTSQKPCLIDPSVMERHTESKRESGKGRLSAKHYDW